MRVAYTIAAIVYPVIAGYMLHLVCLNGVSVFDAIAGVYWARGIAMEYVDNNKTPGVGTFQAYLAILPLAVASFF